MYCPGCDVFFFFIIIIIITIVSQGGAPHSYRQKSFESRHLFLIYIYHSIISA